MSDTLVPGLPTNLIRHILVQAGVEIPRGIDLETLDPTGWEIGMPVPQGMRSVFRTLSITCKPSRDLTNWRLHWSYTHPGGGNNGIAIGGCWWDPKATNWCWSLEGNQGRGTYDPTTGLIEMARQY